MAVLSIICHVSKTPLSYMYVYKFKSSLWDRVSNYDLMEVCLKVPAKGVPVVADD